jgi:aspartyl-tRNA synthetase
MIGVLVNDAKREVEDATEWNVLSSTITVSTTAGTHNYTLTGAGTRFRVIDVVNDTNNIMLQNAPTSWMTQQFLFTSDNDRGTPMYYNFNGVDTNGDTQVDLFERPDGVYSIRFNLILPQAELSTGTTRILVPSHLVSMLAYAKAIAERGEDGGNLSSEAYALYKNALANEVAIERNRYSEEMNWTAP